MKKKKKKWTEMNTAELREATREFDDPNYNPPALKPSAREMALLRRLQRKSDMNRYQIALGLEKKLVEQTDQYAVTHGTTFSQVVTDALRLLMRKKSA